ncbi:aminotransferase-like domain-containing protein [Clostridium sp. Cult2]|uniref:aminotransferase-like domain-containing protein n=1 Tax=Clostridium sp. Cult2 TaxID=2079003 RepID=UPI001F4768A9|nr:PLP-dependent aminotransferase family protein [Clostridium sp. Cult2]MCF6464927.1 aminotransferase [Clostridium sp. Cult2]
MNIRFSERAKLLKPSEIRNKLFDNPEIISFAAGKPEEALFPVEELLPLTYDVIKFESREALQYSSTEGYKTFREIIANQRMKAAGVNVTEKNIALTSGSQQGIELSARIFINEGDAIICESPSYVGAFNAFQPYKPKYVGISIDENGMIIEELEKALKENSNVKMIYTIPDFQNPTGVCMSDDRRKQLVELGSKYKVPIVEDCPYGDLIYEGERHPAVKSFDKDGWVIYLGSFSKIFSPGLRLGWVCASDEILNKYIFAKQSSDLQCGSINQKIAGAYMKKYNINKHIGKLRNVYKERRDVMLDCIKKYFPKNIKHTIPSGGFFVWLELKEDINTNELLIEAAKKAKVAFVPGSSFFTEEGHNNFIRLSFSHVEKDDIVKGMKRLGNLLQSYY